MRASRITAAINFHREGAHADVALRSFFQCVAKARADGFTVETVAVIDRPDPFTREVVAAYADKLDELREADFGDLGRSRNLALSMALGEAVAFFDGDDLWGEEWLCAGIRFLNAAANDRVVCHPQYVYYFDARDFLKTHSLTESPAPGSRSFYLVHRDSEKPDVDPRQFYICNLYTSNVLAPRAIFDEFPLVAVDHQKGLGIEDWVWNFRTLSAGVRHAAVPDTVHLVRVREGDSLSQRNTEQRLLPPLFLADQASPTG